MSSQTPHPSSDAPFFEHDPPTAEDVARRLHAATYAAVVQTESEGLRDVVRSYWDRVRAHLPDDPALESALKAHLSSVEATAGLDVEAFAGSLLHEVVAGTLLPSAIQSGRYIRPDWRLLRAPFPDEAIGLVDVRPLGGGSLEDEALATGSPVVLAEHLLSRLDAALGPAGWSVTFTLERAPTEGEAHGVAVRCRLEIGPAARAAVGTGPDVGAAEADGLRKAASLFGIARGVDGTAELTFALAPDGTPDTESVLEALGRRGH